MIISTTGIEGKKILAYKGIVFGEVVAGVNMFKDMAAGFRNVFGGRASSYEGELTQAREEALAEMIERASERGANAIIGIKIMTHRMIYAISVNNQAFEGNNDRFKCISDINLYYW